MRFLIFYAIIFLNSFSFVRALIAQSVEHGANNARVAGSSPAESIFYFVFFYLRVLLFIFLFLLPFCFLSCEPGDLAQW